MTRYFLLISLFFYSSLAAKAQVDSPMKVIVIDTIGVMPQAITEGMLLTNKDIQYELEGAVDNLYNFKYSRAERQFRSLRRRYPEHPMPYFLLGLSEWWKIFPTNITTKLYDRSFHAYMDTTITYAERMYKKDKTNYEASFFLAAAHGFQARLHSERSNWRKATVSSRKALEYMNESKAGNDLSPEYLFGEALFNYYSIWIHENYVLLRPVLLFFPEGDKKLGLQQLKKVANEGFYTGVEAKLFLMKIYANEENNSELAIPVAHHLAYKYPDNAYFQRFYARLAFIEGNFREAEKISLDILNKLEQNMPGYEPISGRYASYILAYINQHKHRDIVQAKAYYQRCISFADETDEEKSGYSVNAYLNLAKIYNQEKDLKQAKNYYQTVKKLSARKSTAHKEADEWLKKHKKV